MSGETGGAILAIGVFNATTQRDIVIVYESPINSNGQTGGLHVSKSTINTSIT